MTTDIGRIGVGVDIDRAGVKSGLEGAVDDASPGLLGKLSTLGQAGGAAIAAGIATAVAGGTALFQIGSSFDDAFDEIRTRTGAMGDELAGLQDDWRGVVATVPTDFGAAADAISTLNARMGLTGEPLQALAEQFIQLSNITGDDLSSAMESGQQALLQWGIPADQAGARLDEMFRATQETGVGFDELSGLMGQFGPVLREMGFNFDQGAALMGSFSEHGIDASAAMGGLQRAMTRIAAEGGDPATALADINEQIRGAATDSDAAAIAVDLFGRSGINMASAIRSGALDVGALSDAIANGGDTINGAAADTADFAEQWTLIKNRVLLALEPIAMRVFNAVGEAMTRLGPTIEQLATWFNTNLPIAIAALQEWWDQHWPQMHRVIIVVFEWIRDVAIPIIVDFVTEVRARIEQFSGWWNEHWPQIREVLEETWSRIREAAAIAVAWFNEEAAPRIRQFIAYMQDQIAALRAWWDEHWDAIREAVSHVVAFIEGYIRAEVAIIMAIWDRFGENIMGVIRATFEYVKATVENAVAIVRGIIETVMALINGDWGEAWQSFQQIPEAIFDQLLAGVHLFMSLFSEVLDALMDALGELWARGWRAMLDLLIDTFHTMTGDFQGLPGTLVGAWIDLHVKLAEAMRDAVGAALQAAKDVFTNEIAPWFAGLPGRIKDGIIGAMERVREAGRAIGGALKDAIEDALEGLGDLLGRVIRGALNAVIAVWNRLDFSVGIHVSPPSWTGLPHLDWDTGDLIPDITPLASGGVITQPTLAWLGETAAARPEIVTPEALMRQIVREESGAMSVRVFIGERELTDIVRVELDEHDRRSTAATLVGVR